MRTNFIRKAFLLSAALFSTSFAASEKNEFSNTATFIGGPIDGIDEGKKCDVNLKDIKQYAVVSDKVFGMENICEENYVVALATSEEDVAKYPMVKARIVESSQACNDAQVILDKNTYDVLSKSEEKADIIWAVVDSEGNFKIKVNYEAFFNFDDTVGIPGDVLEKMFEESAKKMVLDKVDAQPYPWEVSNQRSSHYVGPAAVVAAAAGLVCFAGYKIKSKRVAESENSLAIPDLPALDTTVNTVSDHPDGLPRVDIYNPPLEFYHFPMDTSYDIVDIRPDFYD